MDDLEEKLGAVLNNPQMMQQLMAMAQSLSAQAPPPKKEAPPPAPAPSVPDVDLASLQKLVSFARQGNLDKDQQSLLKALGPFLSGERIRKLERAMRAAKMAQFASSAFGKGGIPFQSGR